MNFLKKLFSGSPGGGGSSDPSGMYFYVQPDGCDEVIRVRIDRNNDLSLADDGSSLWVHKGVRGVKCRQGVELYLYFDSNRRLQNSEIEGGAMVSRDAYDEWVMKQENKA
jgi:hypothetical protein